MAPPRIAKYLLVIGIAVLLAAQVAEVAADRRTAIVINDLSQLAAGLSAALTAAIGAIRAQGWERTWRVLLGLGTFGWSVGQAVWSWYQVVSGREIPSPSWADVGYLSIAPFALAALVVFARHSTGGLNRPAAPRLAGLRLVIDGALIVASLFLITWATALGATVHQDASTPAAFITAISYPITDLTLVAIVFLIYTTRTTGRGRLPQLAFLGLGLVGLAISDSLFTYYVSTGATELPIAGDLGFIAGPVCLAVAAAMRPAGEPRAPAHGARRSAQWPALLAPYLPLALATLLLAVEVIGRREVDGVEVAVALVILALVVVRQAITFVAFRQQQLTAAHESQASFRQVAESAVASLGTSLTPAEAPLEAEISDVSQALASNVERLRLLARRAEQFEAQLRASGARIAAAGNADTTRGYTEMVGALRSEIKEQMRSHIDVLVSENGRQLDGLRRSGNRVEFWTFAGGVVLGTLANVVVALLIH
jgi:hypothetical protein